MSQMNMASLSKRGVFLAKGMMPHIPQAMIDASEFPLKPDLTIDLAVAENWLVRLETLEIFREVSIVPQHLNLPQGLWGNPELLELLAAFVNEHFQPSRRVLSSHVCITVGAGSSIDLLLNAICDHGDGVLVPAPYWGTIDFLSAVRSGVSVVPVHVADNILSALDDSLITALEAAWSSSSCKIRALFLTNPHNPLGRCYPRSTLEGCVRFCQLHDIHLVSDEVYAMSTFAVPEGPTSTFTSLLALDPGSLACDPARCHVIWSLSKDLGVSGTRMGCTISQGNVDLRNAIALTASMQSSTLSSLYAIQLLRSARLSELLVLNRQRLAENYALLSAFLKARNIEFIQANATTSVLARLAPNAKTVTEEATFAHKLKQAGVLVSCGLSFHLPKAYIGWYRICFALERSVLQSAIERMASVL